MKKKWPFPFEWWFALKVFAKMSIKGLDFAHLFATRLSPAAECEAPAAALRRRRGAPSLSSSFFFSLPFLVSFFLLLLRAATPTPSGSGGAARSAASTALSSPPASALGRPHFSFCNTANNLHATLDLNRKSLPKLAVLAKNFVHKIGNSFQSKKKIERKGRDLSSPFFSLASFFFFATDRKKEQNIRKRKRRPIARVDFWGWEWGQLLVEPWRWFFCCCWAPLRRPLRNPPAAVSGTWPLTLSP